jgi:FAD synthase
LVWGFIWKDPNSELRKVFAFRTKFTSLEALKAQIHADCEAARAFFE